MPNNNIERFTQRCRRVLSIAQEEAERLRHNYIGTEHMLLGLLREEGGVAGRVLRELGLEQRRVEELIEELTRATARTSAKKPELSPGTKRILELAVDEARRMGHHHIGTEHLLLGLVRQSDGVAIDVLKRLDVSPEAVRRQTRRVLQESPLQTAEPTPPSSPRKPVPESTLTEESGQVLVFARQYVDQFQLLTVDPEHILIGLVREEYGIAGLILRDMGLQPKQVEDVVTELTGTVPRTTATHPELSQKTRHLLELAVDEAQRMGHKHIHTEHLLLGLLRQRQSVAIDVLIRLRISTDILRQKTRRILHARPISNPVQRSSSERTTRYVSTDSIDIIEMMLEMVGEGELKVEQASEMLATFKPELKLNSGMQAWLTTLLNQKKQQDTRRVQITVSNRDTQQNVYTLTLSLAEALAKLDQLLLATVPDNRLESVDFESDSSPLRVELRIVNDKDKTDE